MASKWLVTGGAGFIGLHLVRTLLSMGDRVVILDNFDTGRRGRIPGDADLIVSDISDAIAVQGAMRGVDGCFHLAAIASVGRSVDEWYPSHQTNVGGTVAVFDAATKLSGLPVVYASSAAVLGVQEKVAATEMAPTSPLSPYGVDKLGCELHAKVARDILHARLLGLRFFNVYGPGQRPDSGYAGVITSFAHRALAQSPIIINGDGLQVRDFVHVDDVVAHLISAMDVLRNGDAVPPVLNVCTGRSTTISELASMVVSITGSASQVVHGIERPGDIQYSLGDPRLCQLTLGVAASRSLQSHLASTIDFIHEHMDQGDDQ